MKRDFTLCHCMTSIRESKHWTICSVAGHEAVPTWRMTTTPEGCGADNAALKPSMLCCIQQQSKGFYIHTIAQRLFLSKPG